MVISMPIRTSPFFKKNILNNKLVKTPLNAISRVSQTVKVAGSAGIRVFKGEKPTPKMLRESFEEMGTTYIKIGQFIASMPSVFPREYVEEFQNCLDQTSPLPYSYIEQVLTKELIETSEHKTSLNELFKEIDPTPLASASIAQVHPAVLNDGTSVVLKVQKPNVETIINTDLGMLYGLSKILELFMQNIQFASIAPIIDEMHVRMSAETDFLQEADNIAEFHSFLKSTGNLLVTAPTVIESLTTKRVLTMSRLDGVSMIDTQAMKYYCSDPVKVMTDTLNTWFASVMQAKSFHADLHAGNLMLLTDGRIGFIDFGIVGQIDPHAWQACYAMMNAIPLRDYRMMAECMIDIGMTKKRDEINIDQLVKDVKVMMDNLVGMEVHSNQFNKDSSQNKMRTLNIEEVNQASKSMNDVNTIMLEIAEIGKRHEIHFPRDFVLLTKQLLYFDRFMQALAPNMDMFNDNNVKLV